MNQRSDSAAFMALFFGGNRCRSGASRSAKLASRMPISSVKPTWHAGALP
jgi:hypothetical protein